MAITITKEPSGIYPAYNDSYIEFSSDLADNNKAEITVYPTSIFSRVFVLYPDADGKYLFNLKEPVKVIFNAPGFEDANFNNLVYYQSISGLYLEQDIVIKVLSDTTSEQVSKTYEFFKAVKQVGEVINDNSLGVLSYSEDGLNHYMTYFEGFPFSFDIKRVIYFTGRWLKVKNLGSGDETPEMDATATGAFRFTVDRSEGNNWTLDEILPLKEGLNRLEVWENLVFGCNVYLNKKKKCSGVYLKWFNTDGGFSQFLFDQFYKERVTASNIDVIASNEFNNIQDLTGNFKSTGKDAGRGLTLSVKYDQTEYNILKDIFVSPLVQIYTSTEANVEGRFIDVNIDGTFSHSNKKALNQLVLSVDLPDMITAKL